MARLFIADDQGWITADIGTSSPTLQAALEHEQAEAVIRCALLMGLSALAQDGGWPDAVLERMSAFMEQMSREIRSEQLM